MTRSPHMLWRGTAVLASLCWTTSALAATQFVAQTVYSIGNTGKYASVAMGPQGEPRIGFWGGARQDVKLATKLGGAWTVDTAESTAALGLHSSLAVTASGDPRMSYHDQTHGDLKFASRTGATWTLESVDTTGIVGLYTSLELDAGGEPRISYYDQSLGDLKYARRSGGVWTIETVDAAGDVGAYSSLALDGSGNPSISYWDATNGDLKLARKSGGAWTIETVDAPGTVGEYSSLALDLSGNPHVSYFDRTRGRLKYGIRSGGGWTLETVPDTLETVGEHTSLVLNAAGDARISYYNVTRADLHFAKWFHQTTPSDTSYWVYGQADGVGNVGEYTSVALDGFGDPIITYWDASNQNLKIAKNTGNAWSAFVVDAPGDVGRFTSLNFTNGVMRVSYWDATRQDLKLATSQGSIDSWGFEVADDGGNVGQFASLALSPQGDPFLSYWDDTYGIANLKVATLVGGVWTQEIVDSAGDVGRYSSIAVSAQGEPRVSYYDATNGDLKFAIRSGSTWTIETVDAPGDVGTYSSLALDAQGEARISYYDATNHDLKFATRNGGVWTTETIDAGGDVGQYGALALDAQGEPRISYYDVTNGDLKFASRAGSIWTIETIDAGGNVGQHTSIVLARGPSPYRSTDAVGDPRVSYYDATNRDLKFASRTAGHWSFEPIDIQGDMGQFSSIELDTRANAVVAYYDGTNGDLRFAIQHYPDIALWAYPGAYRASADSIRARARTTTLRWVRDPLMESRPDFGGYRIYRGFYSADTARFQLIRRFSINGVDSLFMWHFSRIDETTPISQRIATFIDPDSSGTFFKRCRRDSLGQCYSPGDSIIVLLPPAGPHDGFRTWYSITYEGRNTTSNDYHDMLLVDAVACTLSARATCPNLNHKARNLTGPVEPTIGPTANLQKVAVVPNPYRATEVWDPAAAHEIHFINLPLRAKIRIYTVSGDLVAELEHKDDVRDFERWDLRNARGRDVSSGIYIYRVEAANFFAQDRFVVIR